jgi:hypothetical protein
MTLACAKWMVFATQSQGQSSRPLARCNKVSPWPTNWRYIYAMLMGCAACALTNDFAVHSSERIPPEPKVAGSSPAGRTIESTTYRQSRQGFNSRVPVGVPLKRTRCYSPGPSERINTFLLTACLTLARRHNYRCGTEYQLRGRGSIPGRSKNPGNNFRQ